MIRAVKKWFSSWFVGLICIWDLFWILICIPFIAVGQSHVCFMHIWNNRYLHLAWIWWYVRSLHSISCYLIWDWIIRLRVVLGLGLMCKLFFVFVCDFFVIDLYFSILVWLFFWNCNRFEYYFSKCHCFSIMGACVMSFFSFF